MSNPTPGPWTVHLPSAFQRYIWIDAPGNNGILKIEPCDHGDDLGERFTDEDKANAYLFAAAPEMLAALEYAVDQYGKPGGPWNVPSDPGGWLDRARAAIAKAGGASE